MLENLFSQIFSTIYAQVVNVPVDNALGMIYVVLNFVVSLVLTILGYTSETGGIFGGL